MRKKTPKASTADTAAAAPTKSVKKAPATKSPATKAPAKTAEVQTAPTAPAAPASISLVVDQKKPLAVPAAPKLVKKS